MNFTSIESIVCTIFLGAVTVAITFYIKEYLQKRTDYIKLRNKLLKIAGKNAVVVYYTGQYQAPSVESVLYKIIEIDRQGITLENEFQSIYVPIERLLQSEFILPHNNYKEAKLKVLKKEFEDYAEILMNPMFEKMVPIMKKTIMEEFQDEKGDFNAIIGIKMRKLLKEDGIEIKKIAASKEIDYD